MYNPLDLRKIMVLTDLSDENEGTITYAARLAGEVEAEITLFHINTLPVHAGPWDTDNDVLTQKGMINKELDQVSKSVEKQYGIDCRYYVKTGKQLTNTTLDKGDDEGFDLIVIGTSGSKEVSERLFGSNTYHVLEVSQCPVLTIPYGCKYKGINKMIYATNQEEAEVTSLTYLRNFIENLNPDITLLHAHGKKEPTSEYFHFFQKKTEFILGEPDLKYVELKEKNVPEAIEHHAHDVDADLIALSTKQRKFPGGLFHRSVTEQLRRIADQPFLVLHKGLGVENAPRFLEINL